LKKLRYLENRLTDFHDIWNDDAYWPSETYAPEKNQNLKIKDGRRRYDSASY